MAGPATLRVAVVDDSERDRSVLQHYLTRFESESGTHVQSVEYDDGAALLENYQPDLDIILLDIKMGGIDGMRAAAAIRKVDTKVIIIFVTNTSQYATSGYAVEAQSYLLKPVSYFALETELKRAMARLGQLERKSVLLGSGSTLRRVDVADIVFIESNRHRITVHLVDQDISFLGTLKSLENSLDPHHFYRANSGYLVNLQHLVAIDGEEAHLSNGEILKISRSRKKGLLEALTDYIGGKLT